MISFANLLQTSGYKGGGNGEELKLAKKKMSMKEVDETIKDYDLDNDGKLNYEEFLKSQK